MPCSAPEEKLSVEGVYLLAVIGLPEIRVRHDETARGLSLWQPGCLAPATDLGDVSGNSGIWAAMCWPRELKITRILEADPSQ